jgi:glycosyltransferase involved in cell wall biosynthesis
VPGEFDNRRGGRNAFDTRPQELRYRIADAINDTLKRIPGVHSLLKRMALRVEYQQAADHGKAWDTRPFGVNLAGFVASEKGLGEGLRATLRSLAAAQVPHVVNNFTEHSSANVERVSVMFSEDNPYRVNLLHVNAEQVPEFARTQRGYFQNHYNIGYWNWELPDFPVQWKASCGYFNEIWAPTDFVRQAIAKISPVPVVTIPYAINPDLEISSEWTRARFGLPEEAFVFVFVFSFHSIAERKNPLGLIQAFRQAFPEKDKDVRLVIKVAHSRLGSAYQRALQEACQDSRITLLDTVLPRPALYSLMSLSDCYVSLHRSEGFGFTMTEAMSLGKPVIATAYSGNLDFMSTENSFLVRCKLVEADCDYYPYRGGLWAEPDLEHAAELLRCVRQNPEAARQMGEKGKQSVMQYLHPRTVGSMIANRLCSLPGYGETGKEQSR